MTTAIEWLELVSELDGTQKHIPLVPAATLYMIGRQPAMPLSPRSRGPLGGTLRLGGPSASVLAGIQIGHQAEIITVPDIALAVSSTHACLQRDSVDPSEWKYTDLQSTNGSYRNGSRVQEFILRDGDEIWLGPPNQATSVRFTYRFNRETTHLKRLIFNPIMFGDSAGVVLATGIQLHPGTVKHVTFHARIWRTWDASKAPMYMLVDQKSDSGTFVNKKRLEPGVHCKLNLRDQVCFADCEFRVSSVGPQLVLEPEVKQTDEHIYAAAVSYSVRQDMYTRFDAWKRYLVMQCKHLLVQRLLKTTLPGQAAIVRPNPDKTLLRAVDFVVGPNDFIVLAGASGSGKTTLMHTLSTFIRPQHGKLFYKGVEYTNHPSILRKHIGYVPQDDIIHEQLSLYDALSYAAELRLPPRANRKDRDERVQDVLRQLRLVQQSQQRVSKLSGGQRKRANIAVELLNTPGVLFLDEPTEGQDLALEESIMALLRNLANNGTSVVLVSHRLTFLVYADYVGWLAPGGSLAYYGPPEHLWKGLNIDALKAPPLLYSEIYKQLDAASNPLAQAHTYKASDTYDQCIVTRRTPPVALNPVKAKSSVYSQAVGSWWQQFGTLVRRNARILANDVAFPILMFAQALLIGGLLYLLADSHMFQLAAAGNLVPAQQLFFLLSTSVVVAGVCASMRELVKERRIYWRERMVGLRLGPYLASKIALLLVYCLYVAAILVFFVLWKAAPPEESVLGFISVPLEMFVTLFLTMLGGTTLGLLLSSLAKNQESLGLLVPLALIPQLALSKALGFSLTGALDWVSKLTFGYWAVEALGDSGGLRYVPGPEYLGPDYNPSPNHLLLRWAVLAGLSVFSMLIVCILQIRRDRYQSS